MITDIQISFIGKGGENSLEIRRRVSLNMPSITALRNMNIDMFRDTALTDLSPFYPIFIPGQKGGVIMLDCLDHSDTIQLASPAKKE